MMNGGIFCPNFAQGVLVELKHKQISEQTAIFVNGRKRDYSFVTYAIKETFSYNFITLNWIFEAHTMKKV